MKSKLFFIFLLIFLSIPIWNYFQDEYGVFGRKYNSIYSIDIFQNEQHLKLKRLTNKELPKYDSLIIGLSQAQVISTKKLGDNWYNLASMTVSPYEFIDTMDYLKNHDVRIKKILLHLQKDAAFMSRQYAVNEKNKYFMLTGFPFKNSEKLKFYMNYLFLSPSLKNRREYCIDINYKLKELYDGSLSGKKDIKTLKYNHKGTKDLYVIADDAKYKNDISEEMLSELIKIRDYCEKNNIEIIVYLAPDNIIMDKYYNSEQYNIFKKKLAEIFSYYDFSTENEIIINSENYINYNHFSAHTGDLIIDRIFRQDKNSPPKIKGFGEYVKKTNIITSSNAPTHKTKE